MEHAEAHERLADLALEPGALLAFERDDSPWAAELRAHISTCRTCGEDLLAWRETHAAVLAAFDDPNDAAAIAGDDPPIALPAGLRASVARAVAAERTADPVAVAGAGPRIVTRSGGGATRRFSLILGGRRPWLAAAAALVIVIAGSSAIALDQSRRADVARAESVELAQLVRSTEWILENPAHTSVPLTAANGSSSGLVAWTDKDAVVLATNLTAPSDGLVYRCWVERGTTRTPVGDMSFRQGIGYWWQHPSAAGGASLWSGGRLIVTLGPAGGEGGPAILSAPLPG